jgi:hypothetical protein
VKPVHSVAHCHRFWPNNLAGRHKGSAGNSRTPRTDMNSTSSSTFRDNRRFQPTRQRRVLRYSVLHAGRTCLCRTWTHGLVNQEAVDISAKTIESAWRPLGKYIS